MTARECETVKQKLQPVSIEYVTAYLINTYELDVFEASEVLNTYRKSLRETVLHLQEAVLGHDGRQASDHAHALKGALLNLGLPHYADKVFILEKGLFENILPSHKSLIEQLVDALQPLIKKI